MDLYSLLRAFACRLASRASAFACRLAARRSLRVSLRPAGSPPEPASDPRASTSISDRFGAGSATGPAPSAAGWAIVSPAGSDEHSTLSGAVALDPVALEELSVFTLIDLSLFALSAEILREPDLEQRRAVVEGRAREVVQEPVHGELLELHAVRAKEPARPERQAHRVYDHHVVAGAHAEDEVHVEAREHREAQRTGHAGERAPRHLADDLGLVLADVLMDGDRQHGASLP